VTKKSTKSAVLNSYTARIIFIDLRFKEEQEAAFLSEMMLLPPATIGKRIMCQSGQHGDTLRIVKTKWIGADDVTHNKKSRFKTYRCLSCHATWTEDTQSSE